MATNISPAQVEQMLKSGEAILVDVRDSQLFENEHIALAISIPLAFLPQQLSTLAAQPKKIIFQCVRGIKSLQACEIAKELDDRVYSMDGGINLWKQQGLPVLTRFHNGTTSGASYPIMGGSCSISLDRQLRIALGILLLLIYLLSRVLFVVGYLVPILGIVLIVTSVIGCCPLMRLLSNMPWNKK